MNGHDVDYAYARVLHFERTLCQMFSGRIVACGRRRFSGHRYHGRGKTAWRGKGHDRIGSLGNAASKWRQPTWRSVVKHRKRHKMQWPTGVCVSDHVGNIRNIWSYMPRVQGLRATVWWMNDRIHRKSFVSSVTSQRWEMTDIEVKWLGYLDLRQT